MITNCAPSTADVAELRRLGLDPHRAASGLYEWVNFGTVTVDDGETGTVQVEACYAPATFWRFTIQSGGDEFESARCTVIETGGGRLTDYWPIMQKFASGMLAVAEHEASS